MGEFHRQLDTAPGTFGINVDVVFAAGFQFQWLGEKAVGQHTIHHRQGIANLEVLLYVSVFYHKNIEALQQGKSGLQYPGLAQFFIVGHSDFEVCPDGTVGVPQVNYVLIGGRK